ncbi:MAG: hypothetical protein A2X25_15145 [Chloroflexi bacterium GWB2_49_20]|nr:MAG: hypothetical protein A2X25_15145 [Chloroflexi bacterium GWB2_49_20]OGN80395.1 MAG: hypothetical protein A2X26_13910 [Chloroflexi bacterium GWC2_49_37]OGN84293.1 MAG: hypothetical protein A2X27_12690 [Chloroflexi bacterium GWD2_49_16]
MKQDRFLIGILIFIVILVAVALGLFFIRQGTQTYGPEDSPAGVVRNYAIAVQNMDFERAYTYLADKDAKPSYDNFRMAYLNRQLDTSNAAIQIGTTSSLSDSEAIVGVTIVYSSSDPFSSPWSDTQNASLVKQGGVWKLTSMPNPYWGWDWYTPTPYPTKTP